MPVVGMGELFAAIDRITAEAAVVAKSIVTSGAAQTVRAAQENFEGTHKKGEPHVGGPKPNVVTGMLRRSIKFTPPERLGLFEYSSQIGPTTVYGRAVELGYAARNMRPFPYFTPAAKQVMERLPAEAAAAWSRFLR